MDLAPELRERIVADLRAAGARFALLHGSRAKGSARPDSDIDVAAHFGGAAPDVWRVEVPPHVDLIVLEHAPLELAGRIALHGALLFDDDPPLRVEWQATTRLVYLDEEHLQRRLDREFLEARHGR
jgi:predicted nucleotidyltransferase